MTFESADLTTGDLSRPDLLADGRWHALAARLRRHGPVHRCTGSAYGPYWSVLSHAAIRDAEADHEAFSSELGGVLLADRPPATLGKDFMSVDPPHHAAQRRVVQPIAAPAAVTGYAPTVRDWVRTILDDLPEAQVFDWVARVSVELTGRTLAMLFGIPLGDREILLRWSDVATSAYTASYPSLRARHRAIKVCVARFRSLWRDRAGRPPAPDLVSRLAHAPSTRAMIDQPAALVGNLSLLLVGANDTTRHSLSAGALAMHRYPAEYLKVRRRPELIPNMVAEIIRWQTPVIHMRRTATRDVHFANQSIRRGEKVVLWYLSGNFDDDVFANAERFLADRPNADRHLAFGFGVHRCLGRRLAELQLQILWEEMIERFRSIEVVGAVTRTRGNVLRGITRLPVRVRRA